MLRTRVPLSVISLCKYLLVLMSADVRRDLPNERARYVTLMVRAETNPRIDGGAFHYYLATSE
jgi:hypothetical protein